MLRAVSEELICIVLDGGTGEFPARRRACISSSCLTCCVLEAHVAAAFTGILSFPLLLSLDPEHYMDGPVIKYPFPISATPSGSFTIENSSPMPTGLSNNLL